MNAAVGIDLAVAALQASVWKIAVLRFAAGARDVVGAICILLAVVVRAGRNRWGVRIARQASTVPFGSAISITTALVTDASTRSAGVGGTSTRQRPTGPRHRALRVA